MNETINAVMQIISTVGFPIAMCVIMYWRETKTLAMLAEKVDKLTIAVEALKK